MYLWGWGWGSVRRTPGKVLSGIRRNVFDGDLLIGEVVADGAAYCPAVAYTWGADGLVSLRYLPGGPSLWYHHGPQGETRYLTNAAGAVADSYVYTAYGVPGPVTGAGPQSIPLRRPVRVLHRPRRAGRYHAVRREVVQPLYRASAGPAALFRYAWREDDDHR